MTLYVGATTTLTADATGVVTRTGPYKVEPFAGYLDLLYTGPITSAGKGVSIDVQPNDSGWHSGVVFNSHGSGVNQRFQVGLDDQKHDLNPLWTTGRGVIFHPTGEICYERWFEVGSPALVDCADGVASPPLLDQSKGNAIADWRNYAAIKVDCTTYPNGSGVIAIYGLSSLGGAVLSLIASFPFSTSEYIAPADNGSTPQANTVRHATTLATLPRTVNIPPSIYASAFAAGPGNAITVRPAAVYN